MTISAPSLAATTTSGTISGPRGQSSFTRSVSGSGDQRSIDVTRTTASGRVVEDQVSITRNPDGSATRDATRTGANGQTASDSLIYSAPQGGVRTITGTVTDEAGQTGSVSGTLTSSSAGEAQSISYTNQAGETATHATDSTHSGDTTTIGVANTGFSGATRDYQEIVTTA
jgi:hypothetical protein